MFTSVIIGNEEGKMNITNKLNEIKSAPNVGTNEQEIRFVAGIVVLLAAATTASVILMLVGVTLVATALPGNC